MRFRILLAAAALAALAVAGTAAAAGLDCKMVRTEEWPVRLVHNRLLVDGAINGEKIGIMLDTGAMRTMIFRPAAERLGLTTRTVRGYPMFGVGGTTDVQSAFIDEFRIGDATRKGSRMIVAGEHDPGDNVAVLLGEDFFRHVDVEFDLAHNVVRLFQPKDCDGVSLAYWAPGGASEVAIEPAYEAGAQLVLTVRINGQPLDAVLDSGAASSMLDKSAAARVGVTPETLGVIPAGSGTGIGQKAVEFWFGPFQSFAIGDEVIKDTTILFGDLWKGASYTSTSSRIPRKMAGDPSMLLGADFLRSHRLLIAHSQRKIYFTYDGGPVFQRAGLIEGASTPPPPPR